MSDRVQQRAPTEVRVLVVDDEPLARAGLRAILREERDLAVVGESGCGAEAVAAIEALTPDVVFLDIALPDLDGFDVVERMPAERRPAIVFVTAHSDQALRAFEARALDYVTRTQDRWPSAVDRPAVDRLVEADDDHVVVHCGDRTWRAGETLRDVARRLDTSRFVQIHRSTVVRLAAIRELQSWFHGDYIVILHSGSKLRLSRSFRDAVATMLGRSI